MATEHYSREDGAKNRARALSKKLRRPVFALLRKDEDGSWHVGTFEDVAKYSDYEKRYCAETW